MKRLIATVLIIALLAPAALVAQESGRDETRSNADSYNYGVMAAEDQHTAIGWGVGGFVAGGLFSWLGTGVTVLIASGSRPTPQYVPEDVDTYSYRSGYTDEARRKNLRSAAVPGVIMSTLWTILVLSAAQ
jgi:opacity protein-like surface antigen